jgi:glycosyltransferase involved in cell wall biosynthesis
MRITVAVCTWNRARLLRRTLERLVSAAPPEDAEWELLVVDNNCTDPTPEVLASFAGRLPIRAVREPTPGIAFARNRAVRESRGDCILFTDDDILVGREWLLEYSRAFRRHPGAAFFGGPITPYFEGRPPRWLLRGLDCVRLAYGIRVPDPAGDAVAADYLPFGGNYAIRAEVQRETAYDTELGLRPGSTVRGEETDVLTRLLAAGYQGVWVPMAPVQHCVPRERQTIAFLRGYYRGQGVMLGRSSSARADAPWFLGRPRWLWRKALETELRYRIGRLISRPEDWVNDLVSASLFRGWLEGAAAEGQFSS